MFAAAYPNMESAVPLTLNLHLDAEPDVHTPNNRYTLIESVADRHVILRRWTDEKLFTLNAKEFTDLEPDIDARVGRARADEDGWVTWTTKAVRIAFKAPYDIKIYTGTALKKRAMA